MEEKLKNLLSDGLQAINPDYNTPQILNKLAAYCDQINLFNPSLGLVNASGEELVDRHILDSLRPLPYIAAEVQKAFPGGAAIADLGSGNGMPGLVIACVTSQLEKPFKISLVERMGRRAGFLRNTLAVTGLASQVQVVQEDITALRETYDVLIMRAFRPLDAVREDLLRLCREGSLVFIWTANAPNGVTGLRKTAAGVFQNL